MPLSLTQTQGPMLGPPVQAICLGWNAVRYEMMFGALQLNTEQFYTEEWVEAETTIQRQLGRE